VKRSFAITIAGQRYYLRSDAGEEYVQRVARLVDDRLSSVKRSSRQVATHRIAIMAALQIAHELLEERRRRAELRARLREQGRRLLAVLEQLAPAQVQDES
jgi:cell division protein ZapA